MSEPTLMSADTSTDDAASQPAEEATASTAAQTAAETEGTTEGEQPKDVPAEGEEKTEDDKAKDEPQGAPEAYEDFAAPEGVELDTEVLEDFKTVAKELNLPQESAQKVADLGVQMAQKWAEKQNEESAAVVNGWREAAQTDKDIGGDKLPETLSLAKKAVDTLGTPELREMLETYRLGDHPEFIRFAAAVGKTISEDGFVAPGDTTPAKKSSLYPNSNMN